MSARRLVLRYTVNGLGGGDDSVRLVGAAFGSTIPFDLATTHTLHLTLATTGSNARRMFAADLSNASGLWRRPNPTRRRWVFHDPTTPPLYGVRRAVVREFPADSSSYRLNLVGRRTNVAARPLPSDLVRVLVEIETAGAGACWEAPLARCRNLRRGDDCLP
jgi:hypothetical protein